MSRPKGSVNSKGCKGCKKSKVIAKKKRGRPKNAIVVKEAVVLVPTKKAKFLGHCNKCLTLISTLDLESEQIFNCPACGKRANTNKLKKEVKKTAYKNQKEYLETVNCTYHKNTEVIREHEIKDKDLRIAE